MIEEDAKTKWCPLKRVGITAGNGGVGVNFSVAMVDNPGRANTPYDVTDETRCEGSGCMMWRYSNQMLGHDYKQRGRTKEEVDKFHAENPLHGYCGLAGR